MKKMSVSPQIVYEDNHLLALNKPNGMLVHADITGDRTLEEWGKSYLKSQYDKPGNVFLTPCHRLDRPVSGVCLFARTSKALSRVQELFRNREIKKTYYAIVTNRPEPLKGDLTHFIDKQGQGQPVKVLPGVSRRHPDAKKAELSYELIAEMDHLILLRVNPDTGRPHQIRAQLAASGWPIRCDLKYGSTIKPDFDGIYLHSYSLEFIHPVKQEMVKITGELPRDPIWNRFAQFMGE